jgi:hypothetical protein
MTILVIAESNGQGPDGDYSCQETVQIFIGIHSQTNGFLTID